MKTIATILFILIIIGTIVISIYDGHIKWLLLPALIFVGMITKLNYNDDHDRGWFQGVITASLWSSLLDDLIHANIISGLIALCISLILITIGFYTIKTPESKDITTEL